MAVALVLTAISGPEMGKKITISTKKAVVGSGPNTDVTLRDRMIQSRHAEIQQILDRWFLTPLVPNSTGLLINGMPVNGRSRLNPNDTINLGLGTYRVSTVEVAEEERPARGFGSVPRIGEYLMRRGAMNVEDVNQCVKRQSELQNNGSRLPFGQVAYDLGFVNRSQLDSALADQRNDFNQNFRD